MGCVSRRGAVGGGCWFGERVWTVPAAIRPAWLMPCGRSSSGCCRCRGVWAGRRNIPAVWSSTRFCTCCVPGVRGGICWGTSRPGRRCAGTLGDSTSGVWSTGWSPSCVGGSAWLAAGVSEPTAGVIDSQGVRAADIVPAGSCGYDAGKEINGRRRFVVTDSLGLWSWSGWLLPAGRTVTVRGVPCWPRMVAWSDRVTVSSGAAAQAGAADTCVGWFPAWTVRTGGRLPSMPGTCHRTGCSAWCGGRTWGRRRDRRRRTGLCGRASRRPPRCAGRRRHRPL